MEADGGFLVPESARDCLRMIDEMANPMRTFLEEWADLDDPEAETPVELLFAAYQQRCAETGNATRSVQVFGKNLRAACARIEEGPRRNVEIIGGRHRHLQGIRLVRDPAQGYCEKAGFIPRRMPDRLFGSG